MNWVNNRPEGWGDKVWAISKGEPQVKVIFEAGADAILEALKAEAPYGAKGELITMEMDAMRLTDTLPAYAFKYGWLVFIEDKE